VRDELISAGISVYTPDMRFVTAKTISSAQKKRLTLRFFEKISDSRAMCVVTDETGYVGRSVSLEVGYAYAIGRPLFSLYRLEDPAVRALCKRVRDIGEIIRGLRK
jgi:hypothetical protein